MGHSHLQRARKRQADHGDRADEHADCDELAFAIAHCMPHLRSSPERSLRSACNRLTSAASRPGSGEETALANVVRNPPASVSGSCIVRSSGTRTFGRRIAPGSSEKGTFPVRLSRHYVHNATMGNLFSGSGVARTAMGPPRIFSILQ